MSDLFQEPVPDEYIQAVTTIMLRANWHTYQVLTKRAERLHELLTHKLRDAAEAAHIWWGVSVEDRKYGLPRIDHLRETPANTRFLSIEPLLEDLGRIDLAGIDWVIVGGESGPGARPMRQAWVESLLEQCSRSGAHFFFKQWGGVQKSKHGRALSGRTYDDMPPRNAQLIPSRSERASMVTAFTPPDNRWPTTPLVHLKSLPHDRH